MSSRDAPNTTQRPSPVSYAAAPRTHVDPARVARALRAVPFYLLLAAVALTTILPFVWMLFTSLRDPNSLVPTVAEIVDPAQWRWSALHWENYQHVLTFPALPVARFALNSAVVTLGVVAFQLTICSLAAYGFARLSFRGRDTLFLIFLFTMMIPGQVLVVPLFTFVQKLGWLDTYLGLILPYPYLSTAFGTFLLRQFFITVPRALDDAARLDGCSEFGVFWHVILPSSRPALATVAAFAFIWTWTDFYWPLLATSSTEMRTLEVGLSVFKDAYGGERWPLQMTAAIIVLVPVLAVFLAMQRFFVRGMVLSGLKG